MKINWKVTAGIVAGLAVVVVIIWMSPLANLILSGGLDEQPFDSQQWKAAQPEEPSKLRVRLLMLDDLIEHKLATGMDSLVIKEMLGEPERQHGFSYAVGSLTPDMDPMYLILTFDANGKYKKMKIETEGNLEK